MASPNLKRMLASRKLKLGHSVFEFNSPGLGQIIAAADVDFIFMDMEHSGFGIADVKRAITGFRAGRLPVMVRPPSNAYHHIARVLDVGADGIVMPMVGSAEEAAHIVQCMKYPPMGQRGVALNIAHDRYVPGDTKKGLADAKRQTGFATLIETEAGSATSTPSPPQKGSIAFGLAILTLVAHSAFRANSIILTSKRRRPGSNARRANTTRHWAAWPGRRRRRSRCTSRVTTSCATPATFGCTSKP